MQTDFSLSRPGRLFIDGVARCDGCQDLLGPSQLGLRRWDGRRWAEVPLGQANRIVACNRWSEGCAGADARGSIDVAPGSYRLFAQTGHSTGRGGESEPIFPF